jgi:hypothetical protein
MYLTQAERTDVQANPNFVVGYNKKNSYDIIGSEATAYRVPPQRPLPTADLLHARRRPILPKQIQLQKRMLQIHTPVSSVSWLVMPPRGRCCLEGVPRSLSNLEVSFAMRNSGRDGVGIMPGSIPSRKMDPAKPTAVERRNPTFERSMSHQSSGLTMASVPVACKVEDHANLRYRAIPC